MRMFYRIAAYLIAWIGKTLTLAAVGLLSGGPADADELRKSRQVEAEHEDIAEADPCASALVFSGIRFATLEKRVQWHARMAARLK
ncbi:MAG: hypothetical protein AB7P49_06490, partial [Bdellovibrionales bacterium]